jgi:hypothetical protein
MKESRRSILCPGCRRLISVDEAICPHCALKNPGLKARRDQQFRQILGHDYVVRNLIIANVAMFVTSLSRPVPIKSEPVSPGGNGYNPHPTFPSMVDASERKLPARGSPAHPFQHGGLISTGSLNRPRIRCLPDVRHLFRRRRGGVLGLFHGWGALHHWCLGRPLRPDRGSLVFRKEPWGPLWGDSVPADRRMGPGDYPLRVPGSWNQQLGPRGGTRRRCRNGGNPGIYGKATRDEFSERLCDDPGTFDPHDPFVAGPFRHGGENAPIDGRVWHCPRWV